MAKKFEIVYNKGSFIDTVSKTQMTINGTPTFKNTEKGKAIYALNPSASYLSMTTTEDITTGSLVYAFKSLQPSGEVTGSGGFGVTSSGGVRFESYLGATGTVRAVSGGAFETTTSTGWDDGKWHLVVFTWDGATRKIYIDNVDEALSAGTALGTQTANTILIGKLSSVATYMDGHLGYEAKIYDHILTSAERTTEFNKFVASRIIKTSLTNITDNSLELNANDSNTISEYQYAGFKPSKTTDLRGVNTGTITNNPLFTKQGLRFVSGNSGKIVYGNIGNVKSIHMRVKLDTTTEQILEGAANDKLILANAGTLTYAEFDNAYINGVDTDTITTDWSDIVITSSTNVDMSAVTLGLNNVTYGDFEISYLKFYSIELTLQQAKDLNNEMSRAILLNDQMSNYGADQISFTAGKYLGQDLKVSTGTFSIKEDATGKYINCVGNGNLIYNVDLNGYVGNGYIKSIDGDLTSDAGDTVANASNVSYATNQLTITMTTGQKLRNIVIQKGSIV